MVTYHTNGHDLSLITDGGRPSETEESDPQQLRELFCTVTGTEQVTERQETDTRRSVADKTDTSLLGDVVDVAKKDGLDDTLPEPSPSNSE
ncbi:hypothetical protein [Halovenus sp. HT40]|uniref:hypothetical protein n=1 Tax=Halovenus sp. HT40 TaxID=3126691 RepID=UPI00300E9E13